MEFASVKLSERIAFICILIPFLTVLVFFAAQGNITAIVFLAVIGTMILVAAGGLGVLLAMTAYNRWQSARFQENARENAEIMLAQQRMQNQLTAGTLNYAQSMQKLLREPDQLPTAQWPGRLIDVDPGLLRSGDAGAWDTDMEMG